MEIVIGLVVLLAVFIYYGLFDSVETGARMANRKIERLEAEQISEDVNYYKENKINAQDYENALKQKTMIKSYREL